jgi:hypothetical protein
MSWTLDTRKLPFYSIRRISFIRYGILLSLLPPSVNKIYAAESAEAHCIKRHKSFSSGARA